MKPTKGKWEVLEAISIDDTIVYYNITVVTKRDGRQSVAMAHPNEYLNISLKQARANAKLIAEAGTVANETGKTPRQLADINAELLDALNGVLSNTAWHRIGENELRRAKEAIKNAEK